MLFENMGITYLGPVDGHNMRQMMRLFNEAKRVEGPVIVHVLTEKGRGYTPACVHPDRFHGTGPFDIKNRKVFVSKEKPYLYRCFFGYSDSSLAKSRKSWFVLLRLCGKGPGLKDLQRNFRTGFFDVELQRSMQCHLQQVLLWAE